MTPPDEPDYERELRRLRYLGSVTDALVWILVLVAASLAAWRWWFGP